MRTCSSRTEKLEHVERMIRDAKPPTTKNLVMIEQRIMEKIKELSLPHEDNSQTLERIWKQCKHEFMQ